MSRSDRRPATSAPRSPDRGIPVPAVDGVGILHRPPGWSAGRAGRGRRPLVLVVAVLFALATLATGALSLGAYCLTSDGGDGRALTAVAGALRGGGARANAAAGGGPDRAVVVELFTSQGCSSCPPADRLLRRIAEDPELEGRVWPLALHVDYWNRLGWADPFSQAAFSRRQRRYAEALDSGVYTPQLVIDGRRHVNGSDEREVRREIRRALERRDGAEVALDLGRPAGDRLRVTVAVWRRGAAASEALTAWVALFEDGLETPVGRGENRGRRLENDRVVRRLVPVAELAPGIDRAFGAVDLELDSGWRRGKLGVVALVQERDGGAIHGAVGVESLP